MRILFLGNNKLGAEALRFLRERGEEIAGLVLHPKEKQKCGEELRRAAGLPEDRVFDGSRIEEPEVRDAIRKLRPEMGVSVLFDYILKPATLSLFPKGIVNLHPSLLPYNRGQYPNVWSLVEGTPSGVTLHYLDEGIDTGDIVAQKEVSAESVDTGETLYGKLERAGLDLFREAWPALREGSAPRLPQNGKPGSSHRTRDVERIDEIDLERSYRAGDLINILRARTFPPYKGAFFRDGNRKIYLRIQLLYEEELGSNGRG